MVDFSASQSAKGLPKKTSPNPSNILVFQHHSNILALSFQHLQNQPLALIKTISISQPSSSP